MKNRRNTRRGRAKRWTVNRRGLVLRGPRVEVRPGAMWSAMRFGAVVVDRRSLVRGETAWSWWFPSRAAAMRAAEHLARRQ